MDDEQLSSQTSSYDPNSEEMNSCLEAEDGSEDSSASTSSSGEYDKDDNTDLELSESHTAKRPKVTAKTSAARQATLYGGSTTTKVNMVQRNKDTWAFKTGVHEEYPPMHEINDIFDDMTAKGIKLGLRDAVEYLGTNKLKVATMCSGTESPLLALELISESLRKDFGLALELEHLFSAEIVPFKQAYIERNFSPPIIFRDIRELIGSTEATSAYGATTRIPGDVDLLVAGFSCVDFSNLNNNKQNLEDTGESGDTFRAILHYAKTWRPTIIVLENVLNAPWAKIQKVWEENANYSAEWVKPDTKSYYLPQTRMRGYMICIDKNKLGSATSSAKKWASIMKSLERPVSSSVEAFLLPDDDPRVHKGREEMSKGARGDEKAPREVSWVKCQGRHQDYRADLLLGSKRPYTGWEDNGSASMPDYAWTDWGKGQVERIWDTFEMSHLRCAKRGFDSQYKCRVWELSQNIDRFTDTTPFGICNCITPTGYPYITTRGGPMTGLESLAMQGLPINKLLLTRENQKQLQDLAGNAMSTTVVGAAVMGAIIVGHRALNKGDGQRMVLDSDNDDKQAFSGEEKLRLKHINLSGFNHEPIQSILSDARRSIRLCICEGRALVSPISRRFQRCKLCSHTTCVRCGGNPSHEYDIISKEELANRIPPSQFENRLKDVLPMRVHLAGLSAEILDEMKSGISAAVSPSTWEVFTKSVLSALRVEVRFHSLKRAETWTVYYESPVSRIEFIIQQNFAEWRVYAKAPVKERGDSRLRKLLERPFARMRPIGENLIKGEWQFCLPVSQTIKVAIQGINTDEKPATEAGNKLDMPTDEQDAGGNASLVRSWESNLGLQEPRFADKKVWRRLRISVKGTDALLLDVDISGDYTFLPNCGTASGSLHRRTEDDGLNPVYLFLDPSRIGDPTMDYFVFALEKYRLDYGERRSIILRMDSKWRPSSAAGSQPVSCNVDGKWIQCPWASLNTSSSKPEASYAIPPGDLDFSYEKDSCSVPISILSCKVPLKSEEDSAWQRSGWKVVNKINERSTFEAFAWLTERMRRIPGLENWKQLAPPSDCERCQLCAPSSPLVRWKVFKQKLIPYEDPKQAAPFEHALKNRPSPFVTRIRINKENVGELQIGLNVKTLLHRALANLPRGRNNEEISISWRLTTDYVVPPKIGVPKLTLRSNQKDGSCPQPPGFKRFPLRPEQLRSLSWMLEQESREAPPFDEEEIEEALLPQLGWRAEGRATKTIYVHGGVSADQVGYGKTAITLGLIDTQFHSTGNQLPSASEEAIPLKATLVIVPATLADQWEREISKFLGKSYTVLLLKSIGTMNRLRISDFQRADIIIVAWGIFTNPTYLQKVAFFAALPEAPATSGRSFEAWYAHALNRIREHVGVLKEQGPPDLISLIRGKLASLDDDKALESMVPSKRLRGKAYRADQAKKEDARQAFKKGSKKRKHDSDELSDDLVLSDDAADFETGYPTALKASKVPDPFNMLGAKKDWRNLANPIFQLFHFNRVIVDEYTYVIGKDQMAITTLATSNRWVLSGTPPLEDFVDVKTISSFLGISLGVDDETVGVIKGRNIKALEKDRTAVEQFQSFRQNRSPAWHEHRQGVAQGFLNQFMRQNIAEIDEIPFKEHLQPVTLPAAERAIYLELQQHLLSQDLQIRKGKSRMDNDRERRLNETIGGAKSAEEALLKRCSHFTLGDLRDGRQNATQACDYLVAERERQHKDLIRDLERNLKHAEWLKRQVKEDDMHYVGWIKNVKKNAFGDLPGTAELLQLIDCAKKNSKSKDGDLFYKAPYQKKDKKKAKRRKKKQPSSDSDDPSDFATSDEDGRALELDTKPQKIQALRDLAGHLRRLSTEFVVRIRQLRFIRVVRALQLAHSGLEDEKSTAGELLSCSKCKAGNLEPAKLFVIGPCGHISCDTCLESTKATEECVVEGCNAAAKSNYIYKGTDLGEEDQRARVGRHYGRKIEEIINLISNKIPSEDQVLLFVQYDDLMEKVSQALHDHDIAHHALFKGSKKLAEAMTDFQTNNTKVRKKVLVLNLADESASGA